MPSKDARQDSYSTASFYQAALQAISRVRRYLGTRMFHKSFRRKTLFVLCGFLAFVFNSSLFAQTSERDLRLNTFADTERLTLSGSASVIDNRSLLLTPSQNWQAGSIFSSQLISTEEFSTFFAFRISDPGDGGADGIALIAQTVSASLGEVGGGMGYEGVPNSLAVEFDTWRNGWDADDNHTGLLLNGDMSHRDFPAVPLSLPLEDEAIWYAWIDYDGRSLSLRLSRTRQRPDAPIFEHQLDIPEILNSPVAYVGFAAATGAARARHEILEWTYLERFAPEEISEAQEIAAELSEQQSVELDIQFEFNSGIPTADGFEKIARFSEAVSQTFETIPDLIILGHTDAVGSASYNLALSQRRAGSVRDALIQRHGFPPERLAAEGRGETELKFPAAPDADENRRVEIRLNGAEATRPTPPPIDRSVSGGAVPGSNASWRFAADRAIAPPSTSGIPTGSANVGGFEIVCYQGIWSLYLFTGISPESSATSSSATLIVDGQRFETFFEYRPPSADEGIVITAAIIEALKSGRQVEVTFPTGGTLYSATFGLRGSSRALEAVEAGCAHPTPITAPERFRSAVGDSSPEAVELAREILADDLAQMRLEASKPDIDVEVAWFVDLDDGWRFIIATVGASNFHFGFNGYGTIVLAKPLDLDWQKVGPHAPSFAVAVDTQARSNGWPDLIYQNQRGINQPFVFWRWNGSEYVLSHRIDG